MFAGTDDNVTFTPDSVMTLPGCTALCPLDEFLVYVSVDRALPFVALWIRSATSLGCPCGHFLYDIDTPAAPFLATRLALVLAPFVVIPSSCLAHVVAVVRW